MNALFEKEAKPPPKALPNDHPDRVTGVMVSVLESFGYKPEKVRTWTKAKAQNVIDARRKEDAALTRKAMENAADLAGEKKRGQPTIPERLNAAAHLDEIAAAGPDAWCDAMSYSMHALTDDELGRLRGHLVKLLRGGA